MAEKSRHSIVMVGGPAEMKEYIHCNLCGNDSYSYLDYEGGNRVVRCNICGLVYRNPRSLAKTDREADSIRNYGDYVTAEENVSFAREKIFKKALKTLEKKIRNTKKVILDVGCGQGYFLKLAKERGWYVRGVEPVRSACEYAKTQFGIDILHATIENAKFEDETFDAVTLWNVLDHATDPVRTLQEIRRVLRPGGVMVVRVPNVSFHMVSHGIFSLLPTWLKRGKMRDPSVIINFGFSNRTLKSLLRKAGFEKIDIRNSPLSSGDPYKSLAFLNDCIATMLKHAYFGMSQAIYYLSFGKCTIGTALAALARK